MFNFVFLASDQEVTTMEHIVCLILLDSFLVCTNLDFCQPVVLLKKQNYHARFEVLPAMLKLLVFWYVGAVSSVSIILIIDLWRPSIKRIWSPCRTKRVSVSLLSVGARKTIYVWTVCRFIRYECPSLTNRNNVGKLCFTCYSPWFVLTTVRIFHLWYMVHILGDQWWFIPETAVGCWVYGASYRWSVRGMLARSRELM